MEQMTLYRPKIGAEQVREAAQILKKYKIGKKHLEDRIIDNEQFWKLRHWEQMEKDGQGGNPDDPQPASAWLVNCILGKHADAMDAYPQPTVLPRAEEDRAEAQRLTRILPVILKKNQFKRTYANCWWYKLKSGCAVYGVFWDNTKLGGLGDIAIRKMEILNLFWEPGVTDIQDSPHFFSTELVANDELRRRYPFLEGKLASGGSNVSRYLYDDTVDTSGKTLVVDWYYHTEVNGRKVLQYCKFTGENVLYATENDLTVPTETVQSGVDDKAQPLFARFPVGVPMASRGWYDHGLYPFIFDPLFPEEGTPCGYGYIDLCKSPQKQIDLMNQAILKNTLAAATPRFFISRGFLPGKKLKVPRLRNCSIFHGNTLLSLIRGRSRPFYGNGHKGRIPHGDLAEALHRQRKCRLAVLFRTGDDHMARLNVQPPQGMGALLQIADEGKEQRRHGGADDVLSPGGEARVAVGGQTAAAGLIAYPDHWG